VNELGFKAFIDLLDAILKTCELGDDMLTIAMKLFVNAPVIAKNFVETSEKA